MDLREHVTGLKANILALNGQSLADNAMPEDSVPPLNANDSDSDEYMDAVSDMSGLASP